MTVNICGIPHKVIICEDVFDSDATHFGLIDHLTNTIKINNVLEGNAKTEVICHEIVHGILVHTGYAEQAQDERFVQALGNAIMQCFEIRDIETKGGGNEEHK